MGNHAGRFVDDEQPFVFVDDGECFRRGSEQLVGWLQERDEDALAVEDAVGLFGLGEVDGHTAGTDDALESPGGVVAEVPLEKRVDSTSARLRLNEQLGGEGTHGNRRKERLGICVLAEESVGVQRSKSQELRPLGLQGRCSQD